ncbi:MAG TPA: lysophospholipid acyltransferase family protein [Candidatus Sumerlaeota bacterium]|nr:MAG: Phosphatidylinositol mannoside acyltransferase [candidate division BRC1 bacterium ADurb.Bin183]HQH11998.1 lysophospholipid acyltransferase family protein [Candidatus Sumerlaeota bacterium]
MPNKTARPKRKKKRPNFVKKARRYLVYLLVLVLRRFVLFLPFKWTFKITPILAVLAYYLFRRERLKTLKHLRLAYGAEKSESEIRAIAKEVFRNIGRSAAENLSWNKLGVKYLENHITIVNPEGLKRGFDKGKGLIGLTGHLGNWELMGAVFAKMLNVRFAVVARDFSNPWLNKKFEEERKAMGFDVVYRGNSGIEVLRRLKRNEGLGILADQNIRGEGVFVPFFGHPVKAHSNIAKLIIRTGVSVVPVFIIRNKDLTTHTLFIDNPMIFSLSGNIDEDIKNISSAYTAVIEKYVRQYPDQWMWMHKRWGD